MNSADWPVKCPKGYKVTFEECYYLGLAAAAIRQPKGQPGVRVHHNPCRKCKAWAERRARLAEGAELLDDDDRVIGLRALSRWPDFLTAYGIVLA